MLEQLSVKNVAVIDRLDVSFGAGVSVLTGETGAGKSIIIDSINMILGSRTNKELVRGGTDKAEVQAIFSVSDDVCRALETEDIETEDNSVIITRRVTSDGKSTARINGVAVTLNTLRNFSDMLINIHGQHDNQALLTPRKHITFLDAFAHTDTGAYSAVYEKKRAAEKKLAELETDEMTRMQKIDLLTYQVNEINAAGLRCGEEEELTSRRRLLANAENISGSASRAYADLYDYPDGQSAYDLLSDAVDALESVADIDERMKAVYDALSSAMYSVEDAAHEIRDFGENIEFDAQALDETEERLGVISGLKRKYGGDEKAVIEFGKKAAETLEELTESDERAEKLRRELKGIDKSLKAEAEKLTALRKKAAQTLEREIEQALHELNMEKSVFKISVTEQEYGASGKDSVEFKIATNPGEPPKPLVKIASGGELSRVMLAIKSVLAQSDGVDTLIFDEIDTGVSGDAARKIAEKLKKIGESKQVICITHLTQLASAADHHFRIEKNVDGELARTTLTELDYEGRVKELARIVGGKDAGEEYAREMLRENG